MNKEMSEQTAKRMATFYQNKPARDAAKKAATERRVKEFWEAYAARNTEDHCTTTSFAKAQRMAAARILPKHFDDATLSAEDVVAASKTMTIDTLCGVYFLVAKNEVIYVGQSTNIHARIASHKRDKKFDGFAYLLCEKDQLDILESLYIHKFRPKLNSTRYGSTFVARYPEQFFVKRQQS